MSNDLVHLTGVIKTQPVLDHLNTPDGAPTVRLVNTLIGPANERHTIVFTGDQARAARQALTAHIPLRITGRLIGPRRVEVVYFTLDSQRAEPRPPHHRNPRPTPPVPPDQRQASSPTHPTSRSDDNAVSPPAPSETKPRPASAGPPPPGRRWSQVHRRRVNQAGSLRL
jgi:hypothetical protein